jgi:hypothetical protein
MWSPVPTPFARPRDPVRYPLAVIGTILVLIVTTGAAFLGTLSAFLTDICGDVQEPEPAQCENAGAYIPLLTVGPMVLCAAILIAVWYRARGRPRPIGFLAWAPLLVGLFAWGNALAGGKLLGG